jgi:membrane-associated phospholipid phosphatase
MSGRLLACALALALALVSAAPAAGQPAPQAEPSLRTFFRDLGADVRRLPSNPVGISVAAGAILSTSLYPLDDEFDDWDARDTFESGTWVGNSAVLAAGTLFVYGVGHWNDQPRVKRAAVDLLRAQTLSLGLAMGLKYAVRRERPDHSSRDSFPSGHAAQTFASATVLGRHFGPKAAIPAFAAAAFVGASRVNQRRHFLTDVVFGAGLGVATGWNAVRPAGRWTLAPAVSRSGVSMHITRVFQRE